MRGNCRKKTKMHPKGMGLIEAVSIADRVCFRRLQLAKEMAIDDASVVAACETRFTTVKLQRRSKG